MKKIQILGLFNSGTNLLCSLLTELFDVIIDPEGHTIFWKHTVLGKDFANKHIGKNKDVFFILVTKNPYFQFHSFKKAPYSLKVKSCKLNELSLDDFVKKPIYIMLPRNTIADISTLTFRHCADYWNQFHMCALKHLPPKNTLLIRYEDLLFNSHQVIKELTKFFPLKKSFLTETQILTNTINFLFSRPAKTSGRPRYGKEAKEFYSSNARSLYCCDSTIKWMSAQLHPQLMKMLQYEVL